MNSPELAGGSSGRSHISPTALQKIRIAINIYDLLPPGKLSSILWACGSALLHSGVVISNREYAYGGHDCRGVTGIYYTPPRTVPPGGTFRCELFHGFTVRTLSEIDDIIKDASDFFKGTSYNILTRNCNHFTSYLLEKLTSRPGPAWLNRAASIGVALPCVVPREWIAPPDFETVDGELFDHDETESSHEQSRMLENTDSCNCTSVKDGSNMRIEELMDTEKRRMEIVSSVRTSGGPIVPK